MSLIVEAVYEQGVLKLLEPADLAEGQRVQVATTPMAMTPEQADAYLRRWTSIYDGLSEEEIDEIEAIALHRCSARRPAVRYSLPAVPITPSRWKPWQPASTRTCRTR